MRARQISNCLVIVPVSVLRSWEKEAHKVVRMCVPHVEIHVLTSQQSPTARERVLQRALSRGTPHFLVCSNSLLRNWTTAFRGDWDYVVLDEGHAIKNHTAQLTTACHQVCGSQTRRILLTGTPLMNRLQELWSVFTWATSGQVLGTLDSFKERFARPIEAARDKYASEGDVQRGRRANTELQEFIEPFFLQRLKAEYLAGRLPTKTEVVVWSHLADRQRDVYESFLEKAHIQKIFKAEKTSTAVLPAITWLRKLCGHPQIADDEVDYDILEDCPKLEILLYLVNTLCDEGHRILIFSQWTKMLDVIQPVLEEHVNVSRIDGNTKEALRQNYVDSFNDKYSAEQVMLLSTKAAGVGLTLTGADRCIVYDPSWNPAEDSQAVDRCYRIGQTKPVVVYRLVTAGTVEEKMYEKQVHKDGLRRTVFSMAESVERHYDIKELRSMLRLAPAGECETLKKVRRLGEAERHKHHDLLQHHGVLGMSRHDGFYRERDESAFQSGTTPVKKKKPGMVDLTNQEMIFPSPTKKKATPKKTPAPTPKKVPAAGELVIGSSSDESSVVMSSPKIPRKKRFVRSSYQTGDSQLNDTGDHDEDASLVENKSYQTGDSQDGKKSYQTGDSQEDLLSVAAQSVTSNTTGSSDRLPIETIEYINDANLSSPESRMTGDSALPFEAPDSAYESDDDEEKLQEILERVEELLKEDQPRRAMAILMQTLDSNEWVGEEKDQLHTWITVTAEYLKML